VRGLERLELIDRIGRKLQEMMSFRDIDTFLRSYGVDITKTTSGVNSKWVYTKELLADEPEARLLRIADELELPHGYVLDQADHVLEARFWEPCHFRLFISHLSQFKATVASLQRTLLQYGVSAFVAHVDIEPTREWQDEIEAGLASMEAMAAILMPGFKESNWTDQEVGYAVARGVLIIPVIRGIDPYGFIGKYQGLRVDGKSVGAVAAEIFEILLKSPKTRGRLLTCLVDTILHSATEDEALVSLNHLAGVSDLPVPFLERLREGCPTSVVCSQGESLRAINSLLSSRGVKQVGHDIPSKVGEIEDFPF